MLLLSVLTCLVTASPARLSWWRFRCEFTKVLVARYKMELNPRWGFILYFISACRLINSSRCCWWWWTAQAISNTILVIKRYTNRAAVLCYIATRCYRLITINWYAMTCYMMSSDSNQIAMLKQSHYAAKSTGSDGHFFVVVDSV